MRCRWVCIHSYILVCVCMYRMPFHKTAIKCQSIPKSNSSGWRHCSWTINWLQQRWRPLTDPSIWWLQCWGLLQGNDDGKSAFIYPCHLFTNDISIGDYVYHTSTATTRGHRDFSEGLPEGVLWETGSNRNGSSVTDIVTTFHTFKCCYECFQLFTYTAISSADCIMCWSWISVQCAVGGHDTIHMCVSFGSCVINPFSLRSVHCWLHVLALTILLCLT